MRLKSFTLPVIHRLGYDLVHRDQLGRDPFADMTRFVHRTKPMILEGMRKSRQEDLLFGLREKLKVEPTRRALEELRAKCWVTGLRCTEGRTRTDYKEIEFRDDGVLIGATGGGSNVLISIDPATGVETEWCSHLAGAINGLEFAGGSLYGAYIDEPSRVIDIRPTGTFAEANRFGLLGAAGNWTRGPILLKIEMAWLSDIRVLRSQRGSPIPFSVDKDRIDTMVGIEYYGRDSLTIALEIVNVVYVGFRLH